MRLKAVVFDLDGTLIDSKIEYERMTGMIRPILSQAGVPEEHLSERRKIYQIVRGGDKALEEMGVPSTEWRRVAKEMERIMNQIELEGVVHSKPMKNAKETLMKLKERGLGIGIATRGCREYAAESMKLTGLDSYVNYCLARDEVPHPKPDPRHLLDVVNLLGVEPNSVFYVGDTPTDLDTAKAAGIRFVGYKRNEEWGKRLIDAGCSKMVEDLLELVNMAENF